MFEAPALLRRLQRYGLVEDSEMDLDSVLQMTTQRLLERRLQTKVFKQGLAKSIHHARVLIKQRHIRVGKQVVNVPSFHGAIGQREARRLRGDVALRPGPAGRVARKRAAAKAAPPAAAATAAASRRGLWTGRVIRTLSSSLLCAIPRRAVVASYASPDGAPFLPENFRPAKIKRPSSSSTWYGA